ncbi:WD repeat-containing protein 36-like [Uloborus diversus]|uniref:WD repeat-containing protein 36-like n=1 Tax=Uloborus diversus TaxID=327109 RepID=UPI0024099C24|nr:WD repeat-containing protein 36-like [Uloborus diversus]
MSESSKIFVSYRALGYVSNDVPLSLRYILRRNENLVVTAVGKSFHTYGCSKLNLLSVSGQHPEEISCLTSDAYLVFTACKNIVYAWRRGTELKHVYKRPLQRNVQLMLPFGVHLIVIYEDSTLLLWDIKAEVSTLEIPFSNFHITALVHPSTYLNKVLLGSHEGGLQLWNLRTNKLVYLFQGWNSAVVSLEQAPAVNVVAIGLENGDIYIHNLKFDETIMKFSQDWGAVTALSFRTDGHPFMASASTMGHVAVWDLEKKRLHSEIRDAHKGAISGMKFLPNEPLLVTNSCDNSIKMWIFDLPDEGGRLLRLREGHSSPPLKIRFYGSNGKQILSAGLDSTLRSFSTEADNLNKSLGQASFLRKAAKKKGVANDTRKMSPVVDFCSEATREKQWDNVAAIHRHSKLVTTWSYELCKMGEHKLLHEDFKGDKSVEAMCLNISSCGNFVVIGYSNGHLHKFNMQSGIFRGSYGDHTAHDGCIRGVVLDGFNHSVVSGGSDRFLKFWKFTDRNLVKALKLKHSVSKLIMHRESGMIAVALDNFSIIIVDHDSKNVVRIFDDHESAISDLTFSPDSRWLIVATMDSSIKTWDLPSGRLIDWFLLSPICTSLTMSPSGEYLATAHAGKVGVYLWANATLYSNVSLRPLREDHDPASIDLPVVTLEGKEADTTGDEIDPVPEEVVDFPESKSPEQISDELVTLSMLPKSHWLNLLDLDVIKRRNKPKEPVKVPKNAPFFLPVISGLKPTFFIEEKKDWKSESDKSKVLQVMQHGSEFFRILEESARTEKYMPVMESLKTFAPSKIDVEIRCLSPENGGSVQLMECFLKAMYEVMKTNSHFELVHSYLALFLQVHCDVVASEEKLVSLLQEIVKVKAWDTLQEKINYCLCVGHYTRSAVL